MLRSQKVFTERHSFQVFCLSDHRIVIESPYLSLPTAQVPSQVLVVHSEFLSVKDKKLISAESVQKTVEAFGVLGILELVFTKYVVLVTKVALSATVQQHKIWQVQECTILPVGVPVDEDILPNLDSVSAAKYVFDQEYLQEIQSILNSGNIYFSNTFDLTHSLQHLHLNGIKGRNTLVDDRYFFNRLLQKSFIEPTFNKDLSLWILKSIYGFAGSVDLPVQVKEQDSIDRIYTVTLISRTSTLRLGTRYMRRGLNTMGNAANSVEMEQIVFNRDYLCDQTISSFCQLRGSVPLLWKQELDLSYRPKLNIADIHKPVTWNPVKLHFEDLKRQYTAEKSVFENDLDRGKVVCVNLLDDKGFEGGLTDTFEEAVQLLKDPKVQYEPFPVNKWCKKHNFRNMDILLARMTSRIKDSGCFVARGQVPSTQSPGTLIVSMLQTGLIRVNCLDSLDRTNLTCSMFARSTIESQIRSMCECLLELRHSPSRHLNKKKTSTETLDQQLSNLKVSIASTNLLTILWADSGDAISINYAGTGALKADVTRTGKKQLRGTLNDGINSLTRYYLNNFKDGLKQDCYDLLCGQVKLNEEFFKSRDYLMDKAARMADPVLCNHKGIGWFLPSFVAKRVEPLVQFGIDVSRQVLGKANAPRTYFNSSNRPKPLISAVLNGLKLCAPPSVGSVYEFVNAMTVFVQMLVLVKLFGMNGQQLVNEPKFNGFDLILQDLD